MGRSIYRQLAILLILFSFIFSFIPGVDASHPWHSDFKYRKSVSLSSSTPQSDYQVKIVIDTALLVSANKMQNTCADIRFTTTSDQGTALPYWIESGCNTAATVIWVKIPASGTSSINMYYKKSDASSAENGNNVFIFFDDFLGTSLDTSKWTATGPVEVGSGRVTVDCYDGFKMANSYASSFIGEAKAAVNSNDGRAGGYFEATGKLANVFFDGDSARWNHFAGSWGGEDHFFAVGYWADWIWRFIYDGSSFSFKLLDQQYGDWATGSARSLGSGDWRFGISCHWGSGRFGVDWVRLRKNGADISVSSFGSEEDKDNHPDSDAPTIGVSGAPSSWTATTQTATVTCSDSGSGCDSSTYGYRTYSSNPSSCSTDYSSYTSGSSVSVTSHVWVCGAGRDNAGNTGFSSPVEFQVEQTVPTASLSGNPSTWQKTDATATVDCTDSGDSGCDSASYKIRTYSSSTSCSTTYSEYDLTSPQTISSYLWVCAAVKDVAGNAGFLANAVEFKVDKTAPTASVSGAPSSWQSTDATATATCADAGGSGCDSSTYRLKKHTTNPGSCSTTYSDYTLTSPQTVSDHSWYCAAVKDVAGNTGFSTPVEFKIDKTFPAVDVSGMPASWQKTDATATVTCSDDGGGCDTSSHRIASFSSVQSSCPASYASYPLTSPQLITSHQWICAAAKDAAGNTAFSPVREFKVDKIAPATTASHNDNDWHTTDQLERLTCSDGDSGCSAITYCVSSATRSCTYQTTSTNPVDITLSDQGDNDIYYNASDAAGNKEAVKHAVVKIDKLHPDVTFATTPSAPDGSNGWFKSPTVQVTLTCVPTVSGCNHVSYCTTSGNSCQQTTNVPGSSATFTISAQGSTYINYSATNNAGTRSPDYGQTVKHDSVAPALSVVVTPASPNGNNGWYKTPVDVQMQCTDATSGCWQNEYCDGISPCANHSVPTYATTETATNTYNLALNDYDNAGNKATYSNTFKIDVDPPTITDAFFHNGSQTSLLSSGGVRGNITDRYHTVYMVGTFADQSTGSGLVANTAIVKIYNESGDFFLQRTLSDSVGARSYSAWFIQGNTTYGNYTGQFFVQDNAGWSTQIASDNNRLLITPLEFNSSLTGNVFSVAPSGSVTITAGNEKVILVTVTNYLSNATNINLTISTNPATSPVNNWAWFTKYKYLYDKRTALSLQVGAGDQVIVPLTVLGGSSAFPYEVNVSANVTDQHVIYTESLTVQTVDADRAFFSSTPESPVAVLIVFLVVLLVFSSQKRSDIFK